MPQLSKNTPPDDRNDKQQNTSLSLKRKQIIAGGDTWFLLTGRSVFVYFLILLSFVILTSHFNIPLYHQTPWIAMPSPWLWVVFFVYYFAPVVWGVIFGITLPPFWRGFRNFWATILIVQIVASGAIATVREEYLQKRADRIHQARRATLKTRFFREERFDDNKDGWTDRIEFFVELDFKNFLEGRYVVEAFVTQYRQPLPHGKIGKAEFEFLPEGQKTLRARFRVNPQHFRSYFQSGPFEVNLTLAKKVILDEEARFLLSVTRWSPFLRETGWDGQDPRIREEVIPLGEIYGVGHFEMSEGTY